MDAETARAVTYAVLYKALPHVAKPCSLLAFMDVMTANPDLAAERHIHRAKEIFLTAEIIEMEQRTEVRQGEDELLYHLTNPSLEHQLLRAMDETDFSEGQKIQKRPE